MRFNELQTFVRVVEAGSLTVAAERLGIAKSAVSRPIAGLERRPSAQLVTRTTRRLTVSDAGQTLYGRCRRARAFSDLPAASFPAEPYSDRWVAAAE